MDEKNQPQDKKGRFLPKKKSKERKSRYHCQECKLDKYEYDLVKVKNRFSGF